MTRQSRDELTFLALWRKLARGEEIPPLTFASSSQATSVKVKAYNVLKPYREGKKQDAELEIAARDYSIKQKGNVLILGPKGYINLSDSIMEQLGMTEDDLKSPEEKAVEEQMAALASAQTTTTEGDFSDLLAKYTTKGKDNG